MRDCEKCWGTGKEINHLQLGRHARQARERSGLSLKAAAKLLGITDSYLCYLEQGKRGWSKELWHKASR